MLRTYPRTLPSLSSTFPPIYCEISQRCSLAYTTWGSWIDNGMRERVVLGSSTAPINLESHKTLLWMLAVSSKSCDTTTSWTPFCRLHRRKLAIQSCGRGLRRAYQIPERIEESKVIYSVVCVWSLAASPL